MAKVNITKPTGSVESLNILSAFKAENNIYVVLDGEKMGSMGLPIIYVCKYTNKLEKINMYKTTKIFGVNYAVKVVYSNIKTPELNLNNNHIEIKLPNKLAQKNNKKTIEVILNKMYQELAKKHLENVFEEIRVETGLAPENYEVKQNQKEIATFDFENKNIYVNSKIMELEESCIKYIIIHELCHLKYKTHAKGFYKLLKTYFPNYEKYDEILSGYKF